MSAHGVQMMAYMELTLATSGKLDGQSTTHSLGRKGLFECWSFYHEVNAPRDPNTHQATGRRVHQPIEVMVPVTDASPLILQALCSNESVTKAVFRFFRHDRAGKEEEYYKVTIEDGTVSHFSTRLPNAKATDLSFHDEYHHIKFTYRKVTTEAVKGGKMTSDDWQALYT